MDFATVFLFLFQPCAPTGFDILMRKFRGEISAEEVANLTLEVVDGESERNKSHRKCDLTGKLCMCLRCYFVGKRNYMHTVAAFGVPKATEVLPKILMDGAWARCQACSDTLSRQGWNLLDSPDDSATKAQAFDFQSQFDLDAPTLIYSVCHRDKPTCEYSGDLRRKAYAGASSLQVLLHVPHMRGQHIIDLVVVFAWLCDLQSLLRDSGLRRS